MLTVSTESMIDTVKIQLGPDMEPVTDRDG